MMKKKRYTIPNITVIEIETFNFAQAFDPSKTTKVQFSKEYTPTDDSENIWSDE